MRRSLRHDYTSVRGSGTCTIDYVSGDDLRNLDPDWYKQVEKFTSSEPHLLTKTREQLEPAVNDGRVILAVYYKMDKCGYHDEMIVVGCIVLWELDSDEQAQMWYELGTFFVATGMRYSMTRLPIGDTLYRYMLEMNSDRNILGTTTNAKAIHTGMRHGMQMISFRILPECVRRASCICPMSKTGVVDNTGCMLKDRACRVRVSSQTWVRMGSPTRLPWP